MHFGMKLIGSGIAERMLLMIENYLIKIVSVFAFMTIGTFAFGGDIDVDMLNKRDDGAKMVYSLDIIDDDRVVLVINFELSSCCKSCSCVVSRFSR